MPDSRKSDCIALRIVIEWEVCCVYFEISPDSFPMTQNTADLVPVFIEGTLSRTDWRSDCLPLSNSAAQVEWSWSRPQDTHYTRNIKSSKSFTSSIATWPSWRVTWPPSWCLNTLHVSPRSRVTIHDSLVTSILVGVGGEVVFQSFRVIQLETEDNYWDTCWNVPACLLERKWEVIRQ